MIWNHETQIGFWCGAFAGITGVFFLFLCLCVVDVLLRTGISFWRTVNVGKTRDAMAPLTKEQTLAIGVLLRKQSENVNVGFGRTQWQAFIKVVEKQLGRPVTEKSIRVLCFTMLRKQPREIFTGVGF